MRSPTNPSGVALRVLGGSGLGDGDFFFGRKKTPGNSLKKTTGETNLIRSKLRMSENHVLPGDSK